MMDAKKKDMDMYLSYEAIGLLLEIGIQKLLGTFHNSRPLIDFLVARREG